MNSSWLTFNNLCLIAFLFRLLLLFYGEWQDANLTVKYTDIDYIVFTDAARYVTLDKSPYLRETYRYTPLLAILLTPNIYLFSAFGKCLFATADLLVGYFIHQILILRGMPTKRALFFDSLWLLNPMVANISTRGNAESLLGAMVLGTLYLLLLKKRGFYYGACLFGLAVHFKIYPIIYAVPLLMLLDEKTYGSDPCGSWPQIMRSYQYYRFYALDMLNNNRRTRGNDEDNGDVSYLNRTLREIVLFFSPVRIMFGLVSASSFFLLTAFMYQKYGDEFMEHTYLYHITREDHRHNFSVWFYQMYLGVENTSRWMGLVAFIPQMTLVLVTGIVFGKDIFFACFIQTFVFVTFNKVCTSQYFMWYICLFPLILPSSKITLFWRGISLILAWVAGQALWLNFAYQLEFLGQNTFLQLWIAGILFFIANCWVVVELILNHKYERVYGASGRIRWVWGMGDPGSKR